MGRLLTFLGILSIIGSVVFLLSSIFMSDNPIIAGTLQSIVCNDNETLRVEETSWSMPNGESGMNITYFCDIEPNQGRSVTDIAVLLQMGVFAGLLGLGILLVIMGLARSTTRTVRQWTENTQNPFGVRHGVRYVSVEGDIDNMPYETRELLENMMDGLVMNSAVSGKMAQSSSLTERLQQLEEAYQKNLISKEEYDKVRQAILDAMDD